MRRRTKIILGSVVAAFGGLWLASPAIIKWRVHARYPWMTVDKARVGWCSPGLGVRLTGIDFDKGWVKGHLDTATVSFANEVVDIHGGDVTADLDAKPEGQGGLPGEGQGHVVSFHGLTAHVTKGHAHAEVQGFESGEPTVPWGDIKMDPKRETIDSVCWETADVTHPRIGKYPAHLGGGCVAKDGSWAAIVAGSFSVQGVPYFAPEALMQSFDYLSYSKHEGMPDGPETITIEKLELNMVDPRGAGFPAKAEYVRLDLSKRIPVLSVGSVEVSHPMLRVDPAGEQAGWLPVTFGSIEAYEDGPNVYDLDVNPGTGSGHLKLFIDHDPDHLEVWGRQDCQVWLDALPGGLRTPPLQWAEPGGRVHTLQATGDFVFDLKLKPKIDLTIGTGEHGGGGCKVTTCEPIQALRKSFTYQALDADHKPLPRTIGPDLPHWVHLRDSGPMPMAVVNTEDYLFRQHAGFIPRALQDSLQADMDSGKFVRGGSTIEMQLAKNLWLDRTKTLGRKAQELFLAMALDSCLSKDEILETYLNVVEFGPAIYGIYDGARYWFKKVPSDLQPVEAFWLASILPHPEKVGPPTPAALKATEGLMRMLNKEGRIPSLADTVPDDTEGWVSNQ